MSNLTERTNFVLDAARAKRLRKLAKRRGVAVAVILREAVDEILRKSEDNARPAFDIAAFRRQHRIDEVGVEPGFFESLRDASPGREVEL